MDETECSLIPKGAQTGNHANRLVRQEGMMAKRLPGMDVRYMDLDEGNVDAARCVTNGHAGMGISAGIDDHVTGFPSRLMNSVDDFSLGIALEMHQMQVQ